MRSLAESLYNANPSQYAQYLDEGETGVTQNNYFRIASEDRLGVSQEHQFQGSVGDVWGSYYSDVDGVKTKGDTPLNNEYAVMPRSLDSGALRTSYGRYYNWYAATAESGKYNMSVHAPDSLCPSGWQLQIYSGDKSWYNLIVTKYNYITEVGMYNESGSRKLRSLPMALTYSADYATDGTLGYLTQNFGKFWASLSVNGTSANARNLYFGTIGVYPQYQYGSKAAGLTVRCVKK